MDLKDFLINRTQLPTVSSGMDAYALRQKAIANNIANAEVSGYKSRRVEFENEFKKALSSEVTGLNKTHEKHFPIGRDPLNVPAELKVIESTNFTNGINNVDIDNEMAELTKTQINFDAMTKLAKKQFMLLKSAIKGH